MFRTFAQENRMKKKSRLFCPYCGMHISKKKEGDTLREYCTECRIFFYDNPLPVVSVIIESERRILLVRRKKKPCRGLWCLPSGFAETGETVAEAALRELEEETGVKGRIIAFTDVDSCTNYFYGDLIFLTFEAEQVGGQLMPGDDASDVRFFPAAAMPKLAFRSNTKAVNTYIKLKQEYWNIADSFTLARGDGNDSHGRKNLLSDKLVRVIEENSEQICNLWLDDVTVGKSTPGYHHFDRKRLFRRVNRVVSHFGKWLGGGHDEKDIRNFYMELGKERKKEGFALTDVISALSLTKKHLWEFALSQRIWHKTIDIYMVLELDRRITLFFDRAVFYVAVGYETPVP